MAPDRGQSLAQTLSAQGFSAVFLFRVLSADLQLPEHVMDKLRNLVLTEGIAVYRFLPNRAIRQPLPRLIHEVKDNGPFAVPDILIADDRRTPAPRFPASIGAANDSRIGARVDALQGNVMLAHRQVIFHKKIRITRVAHLPQSFGR